MEIRPEFWPVYLIGIVILMIITIVVIFWKGLEYKDDADKDFFLMGLAILFWPSIIIAGLLVGMSFVLVVVPVKVIKHIWRLK